MAVGDPHVERTADNKTFRFRKLSPYCRAELLKREKVRQRESLMQDMRDVGADKGEMIATLRDFAAETAGTADFYKLFDSEQGKADIFDLSLSDVTIENGRRSWKPRDDFGEAINFVTSLDSAELVRLAAEIANVMLASSEEVADDAYGDSTGDDPSPLMAGSDQTVEMPPKL
jgi:hypothetical protein